MSGESIIVAKGILGQVVHVVCGPRIGLDPDTQIGTVQSVLLDRDSPTKYKIIYWNNGKRHEIWVIDREFKIETEDERRLRTEHGM